MDEDDQTCRVNLLDPDRGVLTIQVPIPDEVAIEDGLRVAFCDGAAEAVAAMANALWPVD